MYWGERKTNAFWKMVVDLSPGSGRAARACLELGIEYRGICTNVKHQAWLANVLDRDACYLITKESPLFEQDLSEMVKKHFQDILEQNEQRDNAEDNSPGSDADI